MIGDNNKVTSGQKGLAARPASRQRLPEPANAPQPYVLRPFTSKQNLTAARVTVQYPARQARTIERGARLRGRLFSPVGLAASSRAAHLAALF